MSDRYVLTRYIAEMLQDHDVQGEVGDHWFHVSGPVPVAIAAQAEVDDVDSNSVVSNLTVGLRLGEGREAYEIYADNGKSVDDALDNNLRSFFFSALHPLVAALTGGKGDCDETTITSGEHTYTLYTRGYLRKTYGDAGFPDEPAALEPFIHRMLSHLSLGKSLHLVSVYYGRSENGEPMSEFWVDGEPVPQAAAEVLQLPWPPTTGFYSTRMVGMLRRREAG